MPQRSVDTGLLVLETPEEKNAVRMVLSMPGWRLIDAAFQNHTQTQSEALMNPSLSVSSYTDFECGRRIGQLQGRATQFDEVLLDLMEQLQEEPPDPDAGKITTESDSLGLPRPEAAELKGREDGI